MINSFEHHVTLTARQEQVLALTIEGLTCTEIGERLHIGYRTVETHRSHIMRKLGVRRGIDAARVVLTGS